jgi:hypothetical protein
MVAHGIDQRARVMSGPDFSGQRSRDRQEMEAIRRHQVALIKAMLMTLGVVAAPFVALLYSLELALGVLALALGFTTWLTWQAAEHVAVAQRGRLRAGAALNAAMMLAAVVILVLRLLA